MTIGLVISTGHRGWAIGELAQTLRENIDHAKIIEFPQSRRDIRSARGFLYFPRWQKYLFMHHALAIEAWQKGWIAGNSDFGIRFTHESVDITKDLALFDKARFITVENSHSKISLARFGIDQSKVHILPHPIEIEQFTNFEIDKERDVIFVSSFYERKNPDLILEVIQQNPDISFTMAGKGWEKWNRFRHLQSLANFKYEEFNYLTYPSLLKSHRVFCSLSFIEGGPVPLLESLAAGLEVVVTDTGHVRDLVKKPTKYNILKLNCQVSEVSDSLRLALSNGSAPSVSLETYSLMSYTNQISSLMLS